MKQPSPEQIARLPLWVREHIANLTNQRDEALNTMNRMLDVQPEQPYRSDEIICTESLPRCITRYIAAPMGITAKYKGLEVQLRVDQRQGGIRVKLSNDSWGAAFQPMGFGEIFIFEAERPKGDQ